MREFDHDGLLLAEYQGKIFEKSIGEYLSFEFSMIMQNREYLFEGGENNDA